ncbi:MAG: thioester domain-containing protein [Dysgonomonas sp.]
MYLISYPRDGDSNYNAEWGHGSLTFMNGWKTGTSRYTTVRAMGSYTGNICYCIEIGVPQQTGDSYTKKGEDFWDNYPSSYNSTISPDDIKLFIGRIFQYGYTGTISTSWRSQNEGGDKLAHAVATQLLIWETVIGERDENFNKVSTGGSLPQKNISAVRTGQSGSLSRVKAICSIRPSTRSAQSRNFIPSSIIRPQMM